ncbi:protein CREG2 [Gouania willdenowi]|uniref:CREG-like beta-barrel domain-containing protein n=1 Tax=Gouania willdenowi TaxID=441366 RepID=A0A8C5GH13_GOUWI|nr:protein CREG2 [Gouania willdenowi]
MRPAPFTLAVFTCLLPLVHGYTLRNTVSWAVSSNDVERVEDADLSAEEVAGGGAGLWKQAYPSSTVLADSGENSPELVKPESSGVTQLSSRLFSYSLKKVKTSTNGGPPPHQETANTARYIAHYSDWGYLATISTQDKIKGIPFGNIFSISDGPLDNSTGIIYFYVSQLDNSIMDLKSNPHASLTFSEAEGEFCRQMVYDPEDPRCARLTLTGKMVAVAPDEIQFANDALFSRHPAMAKWPVKHQWFFMKMELIQVWLQNWFGGIILVPLEDYFKASPF